MVVSQENLNVPQVQIIVGNHSTPSVPPIGIQTDVTKFSDFVSATVVLLSRIHPFFDLLVAYNDESVKNSTQFPYNRLAVLMSQYSRLKEDSNGSNVAFMGNLVYIGSQFVLSLNDENFKREAWNMEQQNFEEFIKFLLDKKLPGKIHNQLNNQISFTVKSVYLQTVE